MNKEEFKRRLHSKTGCSVQHTGWCCATCFFAIDETLDNGDWQSVLFYRGDYTKEELDNLPMNYKTNLEKISGLIK
jgi:hypothetical protein|tara:strand:- start:157 stop:384 length:228 start_codon:yes stop_codon:yes gene_type:complete